MIVIGLNGGFSKAEKDFLPHVPNWLFHDASAILVKDGKVLAAVEEERLNRSKHTNKFACKSLRYCLKEGGIKIEDVDQIAYYFKEEAIKTEFGLQQIKQPTATLQEPRVLLTNLINKEFNTNFDSQKIAFVKHHLAHAYSAYFHSGFDNSLVVIIDGQGEKESLSVYEARHNTLNMLHEISEADSIGYFYLKGVQLLGYDLFDEYKVMGLAPYGNPNKYRSLFNKVYRLQSNGNYTIALEKIHPLFVDHGFKPRRKGENFTNEHKDFAAALQETLEKIVLHVIFYWQKKTKAQNLCLAGGVAHNCSMNGKLAYSNLFKKIFVHPASHDAGAALGAALFVTHSKKPKKIYPKRLSTVYFGPRIGAQSQIKKTLTTYKHLLKYRKSNDVCIDTVQLLAQGFVIGWVQSRVEFGPRALGNRSILADPRPKENKNRINDMVKKREGFRPFAPSILQEELKNYFVLPKSEINLDFMGVNLKIKKEKQPILGAVTHVNGTGRVQTINKKQNRKYWQLLKNFQDLTTIPILLNTSFNNRYEPIVCNLYDSITCFLTTGLDFLVIDDYIIEKKENIFDLTLNLKFNIMSTAAICKVIINAKKRYEISFSYNGRCKEISQEMYNLLINNKINQQSDALKQELLALWSERYIYYRP